MKTILSLLVSLSLFPLVSTARRARPVVEKPVFKAPVNLGHKDSAFKALPVNIKSEVCGASCLAEAEKNLERQAVQAVNRVTAQGKDAEAVGHILKTAPATSASLQNKGYSKAEAQAVNNAVIAAITQSVKEKWEPETQNNVVEFAKAVALNPLANQKKIEEVRENCRL